MTLASPSSSRLFLQPPQHFVCDDGACDSLSFFPSALLLKTHKSKGNPKEMRIQSALFFLAFAAALFPSSHAHGQARRERYFGLDVKAHSTGCWEVEKVLPDSKAAACHFRPGDLVCAVDGKAASAISSSEIAALPQQTDCGSLAVKKHSYVAHVHFIPFASLYHAF